MNQLNLIFFLSPMSVNKYYVNVSPKGGNRPRAISFEGKNHQRQLNLILSTYRQQIKNFLEEKPFAFKVEYFNFVPRKDFYTLKGELSRNGKDTDNILKPQIDTIYKFIGVDDIKNVHIDVRKYPTDTDAFFSFKITKKQKSDLEYFDQKELENIQKFYSGFSKRSNIF